MSRWTPPRTIAAAQKWLKDAIAAVISDEEGSLHDIRDALSQDPETTGAPLITAGGTVDDGATLLHLACTRDPLPPLPLLQEIHAGCPAAAEVADEDGCCPLHRLVTTHPQASAAIGWLAAAQPAAALAQDADGRCPLHELARAYDAAGAGAAACDRSLAGPNRYDAADPVRFPMALSRIDTIASLHRKWRRNRVWAWVCGHPKTSMQTSVLVRSSWHAAF
jgi:hypothetical protein